MGRLDERISAQFAAWEERGRGWQVWPEPVEPEPPFEQFTGYRITEGQPATDDGRRPGFFASLIDSLQARAPPAPKPLAEELSEPEPKPSIHPLAAELVASLPANFSV